MKEYLDNDINPVNGARSVKYKIDFRRSHPGYFNPEGIMIFCGPQGAGKTLSAVRYIRNVLDAYPDCIFCSNTAIHEIGRASCRERVSA